MAKNKVFTKLYGAWVKEFNESGKAPANPFGIGCELHMFDYQKQLEFKKQFIELLFADKGFMIELDGIIGSPIEYRYRNKMEYSFGDEQIGGIINLGMPNPEDFLIL